MATTVDRAVESLPQKLTRIRANKGLPLRCRASVQMAHLCRQAASLPKKLPEPLRLPDSRLFLFPARTFRDPNLLLDSRPLQCLFVLQHPANSFKNCARLNSNRLRPDVAVNPGFGSHLNSLVRHDVTIHHAAYYCDGNFDIGIHAGHRI